MKDYKVGDSVKEATPGAVAYKKKEENLDEYSGGAKKKTKQKEKGGASGKQKENSPGVGAGNNNNKENSDQNNSKKPKYKPLYKQDGKTNDVVLLPGRHACECQAVKHKLINNCISCGRIVCAQEGSGACFFCGELVCTKEEQEVLNRQSRKSEQLLMKLTTSSRNAYKYSKDSEENQQKAIANKNRLLEYDINCEKRTKVIDDESDYFNIDSNKWLTPEQRLALEKKKEELHSERHKSRREKKLIFDFAGRKVTEDTSVPEYILEEDRQMQQLFKNDAFSVEAELKKREAEGSGLLDPGVVLTNLTYNYDLEYHEYHGKLDSSKAKGGIGNHLGKVQDASLQEITDQGICLSMHQPWASLLVIGIKLHEGRSWYSNHRGRLWIHAASKVPTQVEVDGLQRFYELHSGVKTTQFPPHYPTSCLVGCVDVIDVLSQEEYREKYPDGESNSPYVFICENPLELLIKFPMQGKHKLFQLDPKILKAAQKTVKKSPAERGSGVMGL
eukprot:TRINITY_DN1447_c0_g1_i1.p1 TRINITY_DN1447_c0_g1~~TRINITY_DN1447_c0_g1_i1.p1  ORF type:complete len:502 (-),score=131.64 TRINITY_DN1447_c0_g1_i1:155-1660(-)